MWVIRFENCPLHGREVIDGRDYQMSVGSSTNQPKDIQNAIRIVTSATKPASRGRPRLAINPTSYELRATGCDALFLSLSQFLVCDNGV